MHLRTRHKTPVSLPSLPHDSTTVTKQGLNSQRRRVQLTFIRACLDNLAPRIPKILKSTINASIGMAFTLLLSLRERGIILGSNPSGLVGLQRARCTIQRPKLISPTAPAKSLLITLVLQTIILRKFQRCHGHWLENQPLFDGLVVPICARAMELWHGATIVAPCLAQHYDRQLHSSPPASHHFAPRMGSYVLPPLGTGSGYIVQITSGASFDLLTDGKELKKLPGDMPQVRQFRAQANSDNTHSQQ